MPAKFSETQIDALKEAHNIGAGHAAIALSQMLNRKIMITVTRFEIIPSDIFLNTMIASTEKMCVGVYLRTLGDIQGALIFMFEKKSALQLSGLLLPRENHDTQFISEKAQSALKELASILTGTFFSVLSDMLGLKVFHKSPHFVFDAPDIIILMAISPACKFKSLTEIPNSSINSPVSPN